ncbi:hypothetical protein HA402_002278 [Bradysia odoriphaga]|nr:hypothetical protein HA402_002278 [Bradysia odoriphaga]
MFLKAVLFVFTVNRICESCAREIPVFHGINVNEGFPPSPGTHGCIININQHLGNPQPLLIVPDTRQFFQPNKAGEIILETNEQLELFCSKTFLFPISTSNTVIVSCLENDTVLYNKAPIDFKSIKCSSHAYHTTRQTHRSCYDNSDLIQIGFNITNDRFLNIIDVCYNRTHETTFYTHHIQMPQNIGFQRSVPRPHFIRGQFFKQAPNINKLFNRNKQKTVFEQTLGHSNISTHFADDKKSLFLVRGHLTPKVDFLFGSQQRATFWLINSAPQWQSFNSGNWERIEQGIRQLIADRNIVANIYTGTYGILSYRDAIGQAKPIYLSNKFNGSSVVPVPKLFYKVVLTVDSTLGVAVIGVNNPFATIEEIESEYVICEDVADELLWFKWDRKNIVKGYTYACEVNEFAKVVKHLPINVTDHVTLLV